jgi:hypothetical protein
MSSGDIDRSLDAPAPPGRTDDPRLPAASLRPPESGTLLPIGGRMRENVLGQVGKRDVGKKKETPRWTPLRLVPKGPNEPARGEAPGTEVSSRNEPCKGGTRDGSPGRPRRPVSRWIPDLRLQSRGGDSRVLLIGHGGGSHLAGSGSTARADFRRVGDPVRGEPGWTIGSYKTCCRCRRPRWQGLVRPPVVLISNRWALHDQSRIPAASRAHQRVSRGDPAPPACRDPRCRFGTSQA